MTHLVMYNNQPLHVDLCAHLDSDKLKNKLVNNKYSFFPIEEILLFCYVVFRVNVRITPSAWVEYSTL